MGGWSGLPFALAHPERVSALVLSGTPAGVPTPKVREAFAAAMEKALPDAEERPTLSIGIGIGHVMEGMGKLLELGRAAERLAKDSRDALAVILDKRSGGRRQWRARWGEDPVARLQHDAALVDAILSVKKVHEIGAILRRLPEPGSFGGDGAAWCAVLRGEVGRALSRNEKAPLGFDRVGLAVSETDYGAAHAAVARWVDRLLIARALADARPRPRPKKGEAAKAEAAA